MKEETINKELEEELSSLIRKELEVSSKDGLVTILVSGFAAYKKVTINGNLDDVTKEELEEEMLDAIIRARLEVQHEMSGFVKDILESAEENNKKEEDDDNAIEVENVS